MKTVHNQTEGRRSRMAYSPDRHYVRVEIQHSAWDFDNAQNLLDMVDPVTGEDAYRIEADPSTDEGRRKSGNRRLMVLSCSKEFHDRQVKSSADASTTQARMRLLDEQKNPNEFEKFGPSGAAIEVKLPQAGIISAA